MVTLLGASCTIFSAPVPPLPSGPLLPPIELQPPSPPQTIGLAASATGNKTLRREGETCAAEPPATTLDSLSPTNSSTSLFFTPKSSPHPPSSPKKLGISQGPGKSPGSPQSASLGRVTAATVAAGSEGVSGQGGASVPRRNSLGDLKIPARISQAQVGIKRDLGMVKEFATSVDQLKDLQQVYNDLVAEVQTIFESHIQQHARQIPAIVAPRTTSPSFFANLTRPKSRIRSYTSPAGQTSLSSSPSLQDVTTAQLAYKEMAAAFYTINSKYRISWECAELLIELGGGAPATSAVSSASPPPPSASAQPLRQAQAAIFDGVGKKKSRERAITLAGDQAKPYPSASTSLVGSASLPTSAPYPDTSGPPPASPPNMSWRASTGRHDLSQRQLSLLRDMLNNANATSANDDSQLSIPEESLHALNKEWRWGDARNSTITLPSEESSAIHHERYVSGEKKRRTGVLGMVGIRDMLRALKRSHTEGEASLASPPSSATRTSRKLPKAAQSTTSLSTQSSGASKKHQYAHGRLPSNRRRDRSSTGPDTVRASQDLEREGRVTSHANVPFVLPKPSVRRPSLASIFRIGTKHRTAHMPSDEISIASPPTSATQVDEQLAQSSGTGEDSSSASEEDWDRIESASDLGVASQALGRGSDGSATVRGGSQRQGKKGHSPYLQHASFEPPPLPLPTPALSVPGQSMGYSLRHSVIPKRSFNASSSSLRNGEPPLQASPHGSSTHMAPRTIRLSNVEEHTDEPNSPGAGGPTPSSPSSPTSTVHPNTNARHSTIAAYPLPASSIRAKAHKNGSVRSMPPQLVASATSPSLQDAKLAMTPENIKPLVENAKEVLEKLHECVAEIRALIEACDGQKGAEIAAV